MGMFKSNRQIAYAIMTEIEVLLSSWLAQTSTKNAEDLKIVSYAKIKCVEMSNGETGASVNI
jgi:hypothetical protein